MLTAWRIVRRARADDAFSGEGAKRYGGRWNSVGVRAIYVSDSLALAALETLVHLNPQLAMPYVCFRLEWSSKMTEEISTPPGGWDASPAGPASQKIGDAWIAAGKSLALSLPSVLIPNQRNFLLNPDHPEFLKIKIHAPTPFAFDRRLLS